MSVAAAATQLWSRCARCTHHPIIDGGSASAAAIINVGGSASAASPINVGGSASAASSINDGGSASAIINGGGSSRSISGGHRPWK